MEVKLLYTLEETSKSIFSYHDVKTILGTSDASVRNVLYRLKKKNRVIEIEKGKYVLCPAKSGLDALWVEHPFVIVPSLVSDYYIAFWSALNYWGMTEQIPQAVFIATTKRKRDLEYGNQKFKFILLSKKKFFGYVLRKIENTSFNISNKEKTIIDCLIHPKYCGGVVEVTKGIWNAKEELNWDKILEMINKVGVDAVMRRIGYILELLDIDDQITHKFFKSNFMGYRWLDPSAKRDIFAYSKRWGLKINVKEENLLSWRFF